MNAIHDFFSWLFSADSRTAWFTAIVIFVSMLFSAWVAARVTRRTAAKLIAQRDFELRAAAITTLVDAATEAAVWNSLSPAEQVLSDRAVGQAETMIRMLPVKGADAAATWAAHQLAELKRASASFGYELDPAVSQFRDRLVEWQKSPSRARRGFLSDLTSWSVLDQTPAAQLAAEQNLWEAEQHHQRFEQPLAEAPVATPTAVLEQAVAVEPQLAEPQPVEPQPVEPVRTATDLFAAIRDESELPPTARQNFIQPTVTPAPAAEEPADDAVPEAEESAPAAEPSPSAVPTATKDWPSTSIWGGPHN